MPSVIANSLPSDQDIAGLLSDYRWYTSPFLYFSFPTLASQFTGYPDDSEPDIGFAQLNAAQQGVVVSILEQVEDLTTLVFRNAADFSKPPEEAELRFGLTDDTETAHAYNPSDHELAGDVWFGNSSGRFDAPVRGTYAYMGFLHEIGHALGLKHPHETDVFGAMDVAHDNMNYTVISYRSYAGMDVDAGYGNEEFGYAQTFMMYDIAALQYMYGADFGMNSGDSVYKWDPLSGKMTINGVDELIPGANKIFMTVWDGGGVDTYDLSGYATGVTINLNPGQWSKTSSAQRAYLGDGHFAEGNIANALQYQNDSRSLIENAIGGSGHDRLTGNQIANVLIGGAGSDILYGGGDDDRLEGGDDADQLFGDAGSDTIYGGAGDDFLFDDDEFGGAGNDQFFGGDGWDGMNIVRRGLSAPTQVLLDGGAGPDVITFTGGTFQDDAILIGGEGDDSIAAFRGRTLTIDAGAGDDRVGLYFLGAITTITLGGGKDYLALNAYLGAPPAAGGSITVTDFEIGAAGDRLELLGYLVDRLDNWDPAANPFATHLRLVQEGADTLLQIDSDGPGAAAPFETLLRLQNVQIAALGVYNLGGYAGDGSAPVPTTIVGTEGLDQLWGTGGDDLIQGLGSQDEIFGGGGNDRIEGGDGDDLLYGQFGDDQLFGEAGTDNLNDEEGGNDQFFGGAEQDYLVIIRKDGKPLSNVLLDGGEGNDYLSFSAIQRTDGATLVGGNGDDEIHATGDGEIIVDAGGGADHVVINYSDGHFVLTLGAGADLVEVGADFGLGAGLSLVFNDFAAGSGAGSDVVNLANYLSQRLQNWDGTANPFEAGYLQLVQSGADALLTVDFDGAAGPGGASTLITFRNVSAGALTAANLGGLELRSDDVLNGTPGADTMAGGAGNDTYIVDDAGDVVVEAANEGFDVVFSSVSYTLGAGVDVEVLSARVWEATTALDLTGNEIVNTLIGNAGANRLHGGGGNDIIDGREGDDVLFGDAGADTLNGGTGNDIYVVEDSGDAVFENSGEGHDVIFAAVSYTLPEDSEIEVLSARFWEDTTALNLTGSSTANVLIGNAGDNILDGAGGADNMSGREGNDIYVVDNLGDVVTELASQGTDVVFASVSYTLAAGSEVEILSARFWEATSAIALTGNELVNTIIGNAGANILHGGAGNDIINGREGDDVLWGDAGADTLNGGQGNDIYVVEDSGDAVFESAGEGSADVIFSAVGYTLPEGSEIEILSARFWEDTTNINLTGSSTANTLIGNAGANILDGAGGIDTMSGREGNDTYVVDNAADVVTELSGQGTDIVLSFVSYTLAADSDIEILSARFWEDTSAIGLTGNAIANTLYGNAGANMLDGGGGNDGLNGFGGADAFRFSTVLGMGNIDLIADFSAADDTILLDDAVFTGLSLGALNGNAFVNGTTAQDADDRILYNSATGALYFDADGNGSGAAVQFATLQSAPIISASDFTVI